MSEFALTPEQLAEVVPRLQRYFDEELDRELGRFEAEFLLEFIAKQVGAQFYNAAIRDAEEKFRAHVETVIEAVSLLEKPLP